MYQNKNIAGITMQNIKCTIWNADDLNVTQIAIDDIFTSQVKIDIGREFLMDVVYFTKSKKSQKS